MKEADGGYHREMEEAYEDLRVYDPKSNGIDLKTYREAYWKVHAINPKLAYALHDGLFHKVEQSVIDQRGTTLIQFLSSESGIFSNHSKTNVVVFMDGGFHECYSVEVFDKMYLESLGERENSVPFIFYGDRSVNPYLREKSVVEGVPEIG